MNEYPLSSAFEAWRTTARELLLKGVAPESKDWSAEQISLLPQAQEVPIKPVPAPRVPKEFLSLASLVSCARDEGRWALLYRLLYRLNHENPNLLKVAVDPDVRRAQVLAKSVSHDIHKMHAFVRFKRVELDGVETYRAWHKPEHLTIELGTPFFVRRFGDKPWSIFSPDASAHWDLKELKFGPGMSQNDFEHRDPMDEIWKTYYKSIFNPSRMKLKMMRQEMAPKYWSSLPEAEIIRDLVRATPKRLQNMKDDSPHYLAQPPKGVHWGELAESARACTACPLWAPATQTVFGEGELEADIMIVGEQPGDQEDLEGRPFVGPAGEIFNEALKHAGLDRNTLYVTNAVKHFKFVREGKARIHKKASGSEMHACKPWLEEEIHRVRPKVILALGATAGTAIYGRLVKIQTERGVPVTSSPFAKTISTSWHPAAILRAVSEEERAKRFSELVADLKAAAEWIRE